MNLVQRYLVYIHCPISDARVWFLLNISLLWMMIRRYRCIPGIKLRGCRLPDFNICDEWIHIQDICFQMDDFTFSQVKMRCSHDYHVIWLIGAYSTGVRCAVIRSALHCTALFLI
jgi:hypothetical protein